MLNTVNIHLNVSNLIYPVTLNKTKKVKRSVLESGTFECTSNRCTRIYAF